MTISAKDVASAPRGDDFCDQRFGQVTLDMVRRERQSSQRARQCLARVVVLERRIGCTRQEARRFRVGWSVETRHEAPQLLAGPTQGDGHEWIETVRAHLGHTVGEAFERVEQLFDGRMRGVGHGCSSPGEVGTARRLEGWARAGVRSERPARAADRLSAGPVGD